MVGNQSLFDSLCSRAGFGDLKPADRSGDKPLQRQAIWYVMRAQGVTFMEIAEQSHRTHGTVVVGVKRFKGYLSVNNREAVQMYQNVIKVAQNGKEWG
jgi:DNA-binding NarL/FixJ family response regulator